MDKSGQNNNKNYNTFFSRNIILHEIVSKFDDIFYWNVYNTIFCDECDSNGCSKRCKYV